jgi:hypothetical protein
MLGFVPNHADLVHHFVRVQVQGCRSDRCHVVQAPRKFTTRTGVTTRRSFSQAIRCFSLYQSRLVLGVLIALIYGGTYSNLPYTFQGLQERLSLLFIVSAILPILTLGALPIFAHNDKVGCCCLSTFPPMALKFMRVWSCLSRF